MKVHHINILNRDNYKNFSSSKKDVKTFSEQTNENSQKVYATHLNFKSNSTIPVNLINEYKSKISPKGVLAIEAFLELNAPKETLEKLFYYI
jgi:hypothetical protein